MTFLHCVFSNVSSSCLRQWMHNHTGCICLTLLHCVFSNESSNCLPERMHNHTGCICLTFLHCVFSNVSSNCLLERMHSHIDCICLSFLHCAFSDVSSKHLHKRMHNRGISKSLYPSLAHLIRHLPISSVTCPSHLSLDIYRLKRKDLSVKNQGKPLPLLGLARLLTKAKTGNSMCIL